MTYARQNGEGWGRAGGEFDRQRKAPVLAHLDRLSTSRTFGNSHSLGYAIAGMTNDDLARGEAAHDLRVEGRAVSDDHIPLPRSTALNHE